MSHASADHVEEPSDNKLARRILEDPANQDGEAFLSIYARHQDAVRVAMQAAGFAPEDAERRVGAVFDRLLAQGAEYPTGMPLRARLEQIAREVAASARSAAEKPRSESLPSRIGRDGFFGSGMW